MSKKNKLVTRKRQHAADIAKEKAAAIKKKGREQKKEIDKMESSGVLKKAKKKGIRIKKGVQIRGIKVVDSDTKKQVLEILQSEAEAKMDQD